MSDILTEIAKDYQRCFKRILIKRRLVAPVGSDYYEADWLDITDEVLNIDPITENIDNVELNNFTQGGFAITCRNDNYQFAPETYSSSHYYGFLTRHGTKVKVQAGYVDENGVEYAYDRGAGFMVGDDMVAQSDGTIYIPCVAPSSLFDEMPADYINEGLLGGGQTDWYDNRVVSQVVQYLYDLQVGGNYVFHPYLEGSSIVPGNDIVADLYDFSDWSCKEALDKMAEASNSAHWIGPDFKLYFKSKDPTVAVQFTFNGPGVRGADINILNASDYNEGVKNVYNRIAWYQTDPLVSAVESWSPGDGSSSFKFKVRSYSVDNRLVTTGATRQAICNSLLAAYKNPKEEITLETKFVPQLNLLDRVKLNYYGDPTVSPASLWGVALMGRGLFTGRRGGINISKELKVIKITHDVMTFKSTVTLREI